MQPTHPTITQQVLIHPITNNPPAGTHSSNDSGIRTIPPTHGSINPLNQVQAEQNHSLHDYSVTPCDIDNAQPIKVIPTAEVPSCDSREGYETASFNPFQQGVNGVRLQREIYLARNHIQSHMDEHYPGKFALTIPDDHAMKVIAEFVAPFGWWEGAYYKVEFDFSNTDKHNEGPSVKVILAPPVAHLFGTELCLAQVIPHSAFSQYWRGQADAKYSSYNFDRVQQMMNVINFLIMDTDFWDEGEGYRIGYPNPRTFTLPEYLPWLRRSDNAVLRANIKKFSDSGGPENVKRHISEKIASVNQKAADSADSADKKSALSFEVDPEMLFQHKSSGLVFANIKPTEYNLPSEITSHGDLPGRILIYTREALSSCVLVSPIVVEPGGEWSQQLAAKNQVEVTLERHGETFTTAHKADYFYPVQLDPQGRVAEFYATSDKRFLIKDRDGKILKHRCIPHAFGSEGAEGVESVSATQKPNVAEAPQTFSIIDLKQALAMKLRSITSYDHELTGVYHGNKKIENDDDLTRAIASLENDIKSKNRNRKNIEKLAVIFVKESPDTRKWKASLKPTKTMAKSSNLASQYDLTISQETPATTQRYRDGMQWGVTANAWLPVMDREMHNYEKIVVVKQLTDFARKTLKLPNKREAITACDANNIIMKSMTMTMVDALKKGKHWLPSQCFLDFMVNAINTHHEIGELYADIKYRNLKLLTHAFSGTLDKHNLKDFAFLINYLVSAWNQMDNISDRERDALRPRLVMNAFTEYLVRVMEREAKNPEEFAAQGLANEAELTLDKIINASKTGFSVVAHQLTILDFLLHRQNSLSKPTESELEQLQILIRAVQGFISAARDNQYAQLMQRLFPVANYWAQPVDFASAEHQQAIIKTVLEKFHERTGQSSPSNASKDSEQPMGVVERTVPGKTFSVLDDKEYECIDRKLGERLSGLKLRKNVPIEEDGFTKYQQSCHYCGDAFITNNPLHETKKSGKIERQKKGFIYRSGMPVHKPCRENRREDTINALSLIKAMENNFPYVPKKVQKKKINVYTQDIEHSSLPAKPY
ncbi:hypothetical protein [Endozoicomonas sp. SCSIO W0465]|uniref:hypothetical protein n=1 Tax=Endozoicomonas sp. SCSIO W0465 TaxID=2918516 RepID=UPI0020759EC2|nr:hypothetical protein [Endozoicomonas sp. SCSIO W0465]USE35785.1 hypothetical protein MJO57_27590 [Endozoicomonas sp. SCSIO W0465]